VLASDEECDDANAVDGDGCDSNCRVTGCGNGVVTDAEQCDDGNVEAGDGCDASCIYELHSGWVTIAAGSFSMGNALATDEQPAHDVAIPEFDVMLNEVTVSEFQSCVTAGSCTAPSSGAACNWGVSGRGNHPVNCVDWDRASAYCTWAGGRLPSEAEWEYAARGGQAVTFPWGEEAPTCGYVVMSEGGLGCGRRGTWPVCAKSAGNSAHGLCDMSGNVWEWVQDLQHDDYTGAPTDGSAWETGDETERVIRGGSWGNAADQLSVTRRGHAQPDIAVDSLGFRCARASASGR
jgi:cysteine-rich repeat protein